MTDLRQLSDEQLQALYQGNAAAAVSTPQAPDNPTRITVHPEGAIDLTKLSDADLMKLHKESVTTNNVARSAASGVPIVGGLLNKLDAATNATLAPVLNPLFKPEDQLQEPSWSERYAHSLRDQEGMDQKFAADHPVVDTAAKLAGGAASFGVAAGAIPGAAKVLGLTGDALLPMAVRGATSGAGIGAADAATRGEDIGRGAVFGAAGGTAGPIVGRVAGATASKLMNSVAQTPEANAIATAADRLGVNFPKVAASDNLITQRTGATLKELPILGDPIVKASRTASEQMGRALEGVEQGYGSGSVLNAGDVAKTGLSDWITGKSGDIAKRLYGNVDHLVDPKVTRDLSSTRNMISAIAAERQQAGLSGAGKAIEAVLEPVQRPGGLNYEGIKTLRSSIGEMLDSGVLPADIRKTELKRIYGALTSDLKETVQAAGGDEAIRAFNKANGLNAVISQRREALTKVIGSDASAAPERVMDRLIGFASGNSRADFQKLQLTRKTVGAKGWDEVASAAVSKIGRDVDGNFSPERFLTAYGKLSPLGKQMLFGSTGKMELVQALEDVASLSRKAKELAEYGNPSGTGRVVGGLSAVAAAVTHPHITIPSVVGARTAANMLAAPIRVKPTTLQVAERNADIRKLIEHTISSVTIGDAPLLANQSMPPRRTSAQIQMRSQ